MIKKILILILTLSSLEATAAKSCRIVLFKNEQGELSQEFLTEVHNTHYTKEVPQQSRVTNQCLMGTCSIHSWISQIEQSYQLRTGKKIELSTHYVSIMRWRKMAYDVLRNSDPRATFMGIHGGSSAELSLETIRETGLIPNSAWIYERDFDQGAKFAKLSSAVNNLVQNARVHIINEPLHRKSVAITVAMKEFDKLLVSFLGGKQKFEFEFEGVQYTPEIFARKVFPELKFITISAQIAEGPVKYEHYDNRTVIYSSYEDIAHMIRQAVDADQNVYVSYDHFQQLTDAKSGILSIDAFNYPKLAIPLPVIARDILISGNLRDHRLEPAHAAQIVGYELNSKNEIVKFKIKNSWGDKTGDHGYFHMYADYAKDYIREIHFFANDKIELP